MLEVCEKYAKEYNVIFNVTKGVLLVYNAPPNCKNVELRLNGNILIQHDKALHLGSYIGKLCNRVNNDKAIGQITNRTKVLL